MRHLWQWLGVAGLAVAVIAGICNGCNSRQQNFGPVPGGASPQTAAPSGEIVRYGNVEVDIGRLRQIVGTMADYNEAQARAAALGLLQNLNAAPDGSPRLSATLSALDQLAQSCPDARARLGAAKFLRAIQQMNSGYASLNGVPGKIRHLASYSGDEGDQGEDS